MCLVDTIYTIPPFVISVYLLWILIVEFKWSGEWRVRLKIGKSVVSRRKTQVLLSTEEGTHRVGTTHVVVDDTK